MHMMSSSPFRGRSLATLSLAGAALAMLPSLAVAQDAPPAANRPPTAEVDFSLRDPVRPQTVEQERQSLVLQPGYQIAPVLTEPIIAEPTQIAFDGNGRMFVLEFRSYMQDVDGTGELLPISRISLHEDTDNDGVYDKHTVYVDSLVVPRFVMPFGPNSILTAESNENEVWLYTDRDNDGVADDRELFATNYGRTANIEHQPANMTWAMDNWLYSTFNSFRYRWTPNGVIREGTANPGGAWGVTQDNYGKTYIQEGASGLPAYSQFPIRYGDFQWPGRFQEGLEVPYPLTGLADYQPGATASHPDGKLNRVTGSAGNDIIRGHRMPADLQGDYIYGEPVARIVRRLRLVDQAGLDQFQNVYQDRQEEFIRSTDPLFRPVQQETAPDGTLYIVDMYRGIIQEGNWTQPESYLRGKILQYGMDEVIGHGRIWRVTYEGMPRDTVRPRMNDETPAELVRHLEHPNGWWRDTAQRLLVLHQDRSVVPALEAMARSSSNELARFHALWTLEGLGALTPPLVRQLMQDPSADVRIQAIRASETLLKDGDRSFVADYRRLANDPDKDVVIQSMLTLNYFGLPETGEVVRAVTAARQEEGVQFVGNRIITRLEAAPNVGGGNISADERARVQRGREIYVTLCTTCRDLTSLARPTIRMPDGFLLSEFLAGNPRITDHREYVIKALLHGMSGPNVRMPALGTESDEFVAALASYLRTSYTNSASPVTPAQVAEVRAATAGRRTEWTDDELVASLPKQLLPEDDWVVTASHAARIVVGSLSQPSAAFNFEGWTTGVPQERGMWFQVDMGEAANLTEIEFTAPASGFGGSPQRHSPLEYSVETSLDGRTWTTVATGKPEGTAVTSITFTPTRARFVKINQIGDPPDNAPRWTMQRMKLFAR